jgi:hypothetical protein
MADTDSVRKVKRGTSKDVELDLTKRCICKPEHKEKMQQCHSCLVNWDAAEGGRMIVPVLQCDPEFGVEKPKFRMTDMPVPKINNDALSVGETGSLLSKPLTKPTSETTDQNSNQSNAASYGRGDAVYILGFIGLQIIIVAASIKYAMG